MIRFLLHLQLVFEKLLHCHIVKSTKACMKNSIFKLIILSFGISFLLIVSCKESENTLELSQLNADIKLMTNDVSESDSTATTIKAILNIASHDGFNADKFQYFTDTTATKALILVRVPELKSVDLSEREVFMSLIDKMSDNDRWKGKEKYIGVFGKRNLMLCKTPTVNENKNSLSKNLLVDYYIKDNVEK